MELQLTFSFKDGTTPGDIATKLRWHAGLFEGMEPKTASSKKNTTKKTKMETAPDEDDVESFDEDSEEAPEAEVEAEDVADEESDDDTDFDSDEEEAPAPKKMTKKLIEELRVELNMACKAKALKLNDKSGKGGIAKVKTALKKKFGTDSVVNIEPEKLKAAIDFMKGKK